MTLSSAAQAIWEAFNQDEPGVFVDYGDCLAAAARINGADAIRQDILDIAAELETSTTED